MKKSHIITVFIIIICTIVLVPPIVNLFVTSDFLNFCEFFSFINLNDPADKSAWINFYGAIIGGSLTLIGVSWTLFIQKRNRFKDLSIQYKPILEITCDITTITREQQRYSSIQTESDEQHTETITCEYIILKFICKNIGRGELLNLTISGELQFFTDHESIDKYKEYIYISDVFTFTESLLIDSPYPGFSDVSTLNITYKDLTGKQFKEKLNITLSVEECNFEQEELEKMDKNTREIVALLQLKNTRNKAKIKLEKQIEYEE